MNHYGIEECPGPLFAPAQTHSATSRAAAESLWPVTLGRLERVVLEWLAEHGPATDEEIIAGTGLNPSTARPRRVSLMRYGLVAEAGEKPARSGRNATVWQVTAASR